MRKFAVLLLSVVLILGLSVSAAAIGVSGSTDEVRYSALTFETIEFSGVDNSFYNLPFPFTSASATGEITNFDYCDGRVYGYQGIADADQMFPTIYGRIYMPIASPNVGQFMQIYLFGGQQIFQCGRLKDYYISWSAEDLNVANIYVSGSYYSIVEKPAFSSYGASFVHFDFDVPIVNGIARIGEAINDYFYGINPDFTYIFLDNISVQIDFARKDVDTTSFDFNIPVDGQDSGRPNTHIDLNNWMYLQDVPVSTPATSDDCKLGTWLANSLSGFCRLKCSRVLA